MVEEAEVLLEDVAEAETGIVKDVKSTILHLDQVVSSAPYQNQMELEAEVTVIEVDTVVEAVEEVSGPVEAVL